MSIDTTPTTPAHDLGMTRAVLHSTYLRRLPVLPEDAPADLAAAWESYHAACDAWFHADTEYEIASAQYQNARLTEAAAIRDAVLAGEDPAQIGDHIAEADRNLRRAHAVARTRASQVKEATAALIATAARHRDDQIKAATPAIMSAAADVEEAQRQVRQAQARLDEATELVAWWGTLDPTHLPNYGHASRTQRARAAQEAAGDYAVTDEPVAP